MRRILDEAFDQPAERPSSWRARRSPPTTRLRAAVEDVARSVSALAVVANVESPYAAGNGGQISADRHSAIVSFDIRGDADDAVDKIDPVIDAVDAARWSAEFGVSAEKQLDDKFNKDSSGPGCSRSRSRSSSS